MPRKDYALSTLQKIQAREAFNLLESSDSGMDLVTAVKTALNISGDVVYQRTLLSHAIEAYIDHCMSKVLRKAMRPRTVDFYRDHLSSFDTAFPNKDLDYFTTERLARYFSVGMRTQFRAVRSLFNWASKQNPCMVRHNPIPRIVLDDVVHDEEIHFLTLRQVRRLLEAPSPYREAYALALFTGIRPEEFSSREKPGLLWENINREDKLIRVPSEMAKGSRRGSMARVIDSVPENLWAWLKDSPEQGRVFPYRPVQMPRRGKELLGLSKWPEDILRKTFCTYHVAYFENVPQTSLIMGHRGSPDMIHRHYRGLATKRQGREFFNLTPA